MESLSSPESDSESRLGRQVRMSAPAGLSQPFFASLPNSRPGRRHRRAAAGCFALRLVALDGGQAEHKCGAGSRPAAAARWDELAEVGRARQMQVAS